MENHTITSVGTHEEVRKNNAYYRNAWKDYELSLIHIYQLEELLLLTEQMQEELDQKDRTIPVSYTHLDVYKRQHRYNFALAICRA